jgi:catalase
MIMYDSTDFSLGLNTLYADTDIPVSQDTVRDVRGFATKFYTEEGNWDIVGNNIPVFFIQESIKFPDLIHAVKPEPHNEVPQGQSAHNNFWDFVGLQPECKANSAFCFPRFVHRSLVTSRSHGHVGHV